MQEVHTSNVPQSLELFILDKWRVSCRFKSKDWTRSWGISSFTVTSKVRSNILPSLQRNLHVKLGFETTSKQIVQASKEVQHTQEWTRSLINWSGQKNPASLKFILLLFITYFNLQQTCYSNLHVFWKWCYYNFESW